MKELASTEAIYLIQEWTPIEKVFRNEMAESFFLNAYPITLRKRHISVNATCHCTGTVITHLKIILPPGSILISKSRDDQHSTVHVVIIPLTR